MLGSLIGSLSALGVLGLVVLVNGGYVYRTSCPRADGHVETSWQWRINDVIPYLGYSVSDCQSHTATRELLSAVGVWKLRSHISTSTAANQAAATQLGVIKDQVGTMDIRINAVKPSSPLTRAAVLDYVDRLQPVIADYTRLARSANTERSKLTLFTDPDLREAWRLLTYRSDLTVGEYRGITDQLRAGAYNAFRTRVVKAKAQIDRIDSQFQTLAVRINSRYHR
jgi:hypothetical protein